MFSFLTGIPIIVKVATIGAVITVIGGVIFAGYTHYNNILDEKEEAILLANSLKVAKSVQDETIRSQKDVIGIWVKHTEQLKQTIDKMDKARLEASAEANRIKDILNKHDLEKLSLAKPGLIENRINRGTSRALRMLETSTGGDNHQK
jgi:hypothetical protein